MLGVTLQTIRRWVKEGRLQAIFTPGHTRRYDRQSVELLLGRTIERVEEKRSFTYCRVSSSKQLDDLERQKEFLKSECPNHELVSDVGSGINWKRKGLQKILGLSMQGKVEELVVAHRDRLARFAFDLIEFILSKNGTRIRVLDSDEHKSPENELADDLLSIVTIFSCRNMGRRRYKNVVNKAISDEVSNEETERD